MSPSKSLSLISAALFSLGLLTACGPNIAQTVDTTRICPAWKQINVRDKDRLTPETASEIEGSNIGRESMGCPYEPPPKAKPAPKVS